MSTLTVEQITAIAAAAAANAVQTILAQNGTAAPSTTVETTPSTTVETTPQTTPEATPQTTAPDLDLTVVGYLTGAVKKVSKRGMGSGWSSRFSVAARFSR